jgi:hypothetical protein
MACPDILKHIAGKPNRQVNFLGKDTGYVKMLGKVSTSESGGAKILCNAAAFSTYRERFVKSCQIFRILKRRFFLMHRTFAPKPDRRI